MKIFLISLLSVVTIAVAAFLIANESQSADRIRTLEQNLQLKDQENETLQSKYDLALNQISSLQQANNKTNDALNSVTTDLGTMATELATTKAELETARKSLEKDHDSLVVSQENLALIGEIHPDQPAPVAPTAPAAPPVAPPPPIAVSEVTSASVLIKGDKKIGIGFFVNFKGTPTLVTVQEALNGNTTVDVQLADGKTTFQPTSLQAAQNSGLVSVHSDAHVKGLTVLDNIDKSVAVGDAVVVLGNPASAGIAAPIKGTITTVGPNLLELNVNFPVSYSGSPVFHVKTGKLIGIAAFSTINTTDNPDATTAKIFQTDHHYAYRLDSPPAWQPLNWATFTQEGAFLQTVIDHTNTLRALYNDIYARGKITYSDYSNDGNILQPLVADVEQKLKAKNPSGDDYMEAKTDFLSSVTDLCESDLANLVSVSLASYHQSELAEETQARLLLEKNFKRLQAIQDNTAAFGYAHAH